MKVYRNRRHSGARLVGFLVVLSACTSGTADTTTSSSEPTTTTTTSSTTTTSTIPLIVNGPALILEGDNNEMVEAFQFLMNCNGYGDLTVDGAFGPATRAAVEATQTALGREVTGTPDDETFAILARGCSENRRVEIGEEAAGEQLVVGNAGPDDPETYFIRAEEGLRLSIVVDSDSGQAVVGVRSVSGGSVGPAQTAAWAADIEETGDYVIDISTTGAAVTYSAAVSLVEVEFEKVSAAAADSVVIDEQKLAVTDVCLDTDGDASYVVDTATAYLVVTTGRVGSFAVGNGGLGAPIELIFKDGSPGYVGFEGDFTIESDDTIEGTGGAFLRTPGNAAQPYPLAFTFDRSAVPCEGAAAIPIILSSEGLGIVDFGAGADETLGFVRSALPGASPTVDSGWVSIDNQNNPYGICRQGTTEVRVMQIDNLTLYFADGGTSFAPEGTRHFVGFTAGDGMFPFLTSASVGPGSTLGELLAAHPDAVAITGVGGGVGVFISSPPGDDRWLQANAAGASGPSDLGAEITSVAGGRFCDL